MSINCLKCKKPLNLLIDIKESSYTCKNCRKAYEVIINGREVLIKSKNKSIKLYFNDLSFFNKELSNKTVYELYNKGYIKCVKTLNDSFNEHYNSWEMPLTEISSSLIKSFENNINTLKTELDSFKDLNINYSCLNCSADYSFNEASKNNFSCILCNSFLVQKNNKSEVDSINNKIKDFNKNLLNINRGWF